MIAWQGQMGVAKESSYGTAITTPTRYIACQTGNIETVVARVASEEARGTRWEYRDEKTGIDYTFTWEQWAVPGEIGEVLEYAFGDVSSQVLIGDENRHTFTPASSLPSFTMFVDKAVTATPTYRGAGAKINTLTLENSARDILRLTVEGSLQQHLWAAVISPGDSDYESMRPLQFKDLAVSKGYAGVSPTSDTTIERFAVTITNNIITDKVSANGTEYIAALPEGILQVTGAFDREFEDANDFNAYVADNQLDIIATWTGSSMGTNDYSLQLDVPNARITTNPLPQIAGTSERGIYTVEFKALYYSTDARVIAAILDNEEDY